MTKLINQLIKGMKKVRKKDLVTTIDFHSISGQKSCFNGHIYNILCDLDSPKVIYGSTYDTIVNVYCDIKGWNLYEDLNNIHSAYRHKNINFRQAKKQVISKLMEIKQN